MTPPTVSVIVPTYGRPDYHEHVYKTFAAQTYPHKDLWLLDDSPRPSLFFAQLRDPRVHYLWTPDRLSIGTKRNELIASSTGKIIAHQDDDDVYAPHYLATMVDRLGKNALTKLSVWDAKSAYDGSIWRWDTRHADRTHYIVSGNAPPLRMQSDPIDTDAIDSALWGYGFSYVFTRAAAGMCPFPDINLGEDMTFITRLRQIAPVTHEADIPGIALHTIHARSTSRIYPQTCIGWCQACAEAPAGTTASYGQVGSRPPTKISLVPGRTYEAIAMVKANHPAPELIARAARYDVNVLAISDNIQPPGLPPPKTGYRYMNVQARARRRRTVRTCVPWPFSVHDDSQLVALQTH